MGRTDETIVASKNPAKYYLDWKSNNKCFSFYDKEKGADVELKLPFKFLFLKQLSSVRGWHDASGSGIYSNEVENTAQQALTVKAFKGGTLATGLYKDIKLSINALGGVYNRQIYLMTEKGVLLNLALKGTAVAEWNEFYKTNSTKITGEWIVVKDVKTGKKGSVSYSTPNFELGGAISIEQAATADALYDTLIEYVKGRIQEETTEATSRTDSHPAAAATNTPAVSDPPQSDFSEEDDSDDSFPF